MQLADTVHAVPPTIDRSLPASPMMMMRPRQPIDRESIRGTTEEEVLRNFAASVRSWRGGGTTHPRFRRDDLIVLVGILGTDEARIEQRLVTLTGCNRVTAKRLRRMLLLGLAALPVAAGFSAVSAPVETAAATVPAAETTVAAPAPARPPVTSAPDRPAASTVPTAPVPEAAQVPPSTVVAAPSVVAPVVQIPAVAPTPAPLPQGAEATVRIARLGIDLGVHSGGQGVIDQGLVAHYWAPGWREPAAAGAAGTYWLAAHHETHGSPFLRLPELVVGDRIVVTTATQTFTYSVTSTEVVRPDAGFGPVYGDDPSARVILLQTCLDHVRRLLVHGTLIATA